VNTKKSAQLCAGGVPTPEQLTKINLQSKTELSADQVYCFSVQLCNDQPDRDFERFETAALPKLAELFIGKTGICDHEWSAQRQIARIFDTKVESSGTVTTLLAWAYMLRGEESNRLIEKIEAGIHRELMAAFREYLVVGGMPQAVECYAKTKDFASVEKIKKGIVSLYKDDVGKYANGDRIRVSELLKMIPSELSRHDKSFTISDIDENGRFSNYEKPIFWLADSLIANICYNCTKPERALGLNTNDSSLKIYMGDTGLLVTLSIGEGNDDENDLFTALLMDKLHLNEGMYVENIVSQTLRCNGYPLYFHSFYLTDEEGKRISNNRQEVDFLIPNKKKISPIEVKSGNNRGHASLKHLMTRYSKYLGQTYIIHTKDLEKKGNILFIPLYMTFCL